MLVYNSFSSRLEPAVYLHCLLSVDSPIQRHSHQFRACVRQRALMWLHVFVCVHLLVYVHMFMWPGDMHLCYSPMCLHVRRLDSDLISLWYDDCHYDFQRAPIGSIKMSWLSAEQGSRSSMQADVGDKIMIRLLSGFHINKLTITYQSPSSICPLWPMLMTEQLTGPLEQWGLQKKWVVDKEGSEYKVHLCNYSGM